MNNHKDKLEILNARLLLYYKAEKAILAGQSYEAEGLKLTPSKICGRSARGINRRAHGLTTRA